MQLELPRFLECRVGVHWAWSLCWPREQLNFTDKTVAHACYFQSLRRPTACCRGAFCHTALLAAKMLWPPLQASSLALWSLPVVQPGGRKQSIHPPVPACNPAGILAEHSSPCTPRKPRTPLSSPAGIIAAVVVAAVVAAVLAAFLVNRRRNSRRRLPAHRQAGKDFDSVVVEGTQCQCL